MQDHLRAKSPDRASKGQGIVQLSPHSTVGPF